VTGKVFIDTFGVFAEFEANLRRERRLEGDHAAKAGGVYKGRKRSTDAGKVFALAGDGSARWRSSTDWRWPGKCLLSARSAGGSHLGKRGWQ